MTRKGTVRACVLLFLLLLSACAPDVLDGYQITVDARRAEPAEETPAEHVFIEISSNGKGSYVIYDSDGSIVHDESGMVVFTREQILETGTFKLSAAEMRRLWQSIQDSAFFELTDDYRMSIGSAYAFLVVETDGTSHTVDNIGMELPEIEKIIETLNSILPAKIEMEYSPPGLW